METSPPVRDISERDRANRNKCIIVAVISVVVLAAIILVIAYITHFSSTELTADSANSLIDKAITSTQNDSVSICANNNKPYDVILRENGTSLLERLDDCTEVTEKVDRDELERRNETSSDKHLTNIICRLSTANLKIFSSKDQSRKDCAVNSTIEVNFFFSMDNKVENISFSLANAQSFRPSQPGFRKSLLHDALLYVVQTALGESILQSVSSYGTQDTKIVGKPWDWDVICQGAPWDCT